MGITVWCRLYSLCIKYVLNVCLGHGSCILSEWSVFLWVTGSRVNNRDPLHGELSYQHHLQLAADHSYHHGASKSNELLQKLRVVLLQNCPCIDEFYVEHVKRTQADRKIWMNCNTCRCSLLCCMFNVSFQLVMHKSQFLFEIQHDIDTVVIYYASRT